ncbi:MAG: DUF4130 domain-containing protein [Promethearchaeota archaeon]
MTVQEKKLIYKIINRLKRHEDYLECNDDLFSQVSGKLVASRRYSKFFKKIEKKSREVINTYYKIKTHVKLYSLKNILIGDYSTSHYIEDLLGKFFHSRNPRDNIILINKKKKLIVFIHSVEKKKPSTLDIMEKKMLMVYKGSKIVDTDDHVSVLKMQIDGDLNFGHIKNLMKPIEDNRSVPVKNGIQDFSDEVINRSLSSYWNIFYDSQIIPSRKNTSRAKRMIRKKTINEILDKHSIERLRILKNIDPRTKSLDDFLS